MDISILSCLAAVFIPFLFGLYLLISRLKLSFVSKKILNYGSFFANLFGLTVFSAQAALFLKEENIKEVIFTFFNYDKITLEAGISLNLENIVFLLFSSFVFTIISLYSKFYFDKKKQFIFTKQRFYIFLSFLASSTYLFFVSPNLIQAFVFWIFEGILIFVFSYFDIFKNSADFNITRFQRISVIGDFSFLAGLLILLRYAVLSEGYVHSPSLNFDELNILISYAYGISSPLEFKLAAVCFALAAFSRLFIFPLSCYCSFFANSSNIFYICAIVAANTLPGLFLFYKTLSFIDLWDNLLNYFIVLFFVSIFTSLFFLLFEKNIKIICGYLISVLNSIFLICYLILREDFVFLGYLVLNFAILFVLMILFMKDKTNLSRRIINKQKGFILEKIHIVLFETVPEKIAAVLNFVDEKIIRNIIPFFIGFFDALSSLFVLKTKRKDKIKYTRDILIIFAVFALLAIFIALFGRYKC